MLIIIRQCSKNNMWPSQGYGSVAGDKHASYIFFHVQSVSTSEYDMDMDFFKMIPW